MRASELKREIDKYLATCDDGSRYQDQATEVLHNFAEELFPEMKKHRERATAIAKLTQAEINLLGIDVNAPVIDEDSDDIEKLRNWITTFRRTLSSKSNCADAALDGLLQCVINMENDI